LKHKGEIQYLSSVFDPASGYGENIFRGDFKMSNFEIATLDLRESPGPLTNFSKISTKFKIAFPKTEVLGKALQNN
jgi:hypothetical protein